MIGRALMAPLIMAGMVGAAAAAEVPREYQGIWRNDPNAQCRRADWHGLGVEGDMLMFDVSASAVTEPKSKCKITQVKPTATTISVDSVCLGEDPGSRRVQEVWTLQNIGGRTYLVQVDLTNKRIEIARRCE